MGLLDLIEKAITEHGSASILKERLALIRDQASALEKQLADCQAKTTELQNENIQLRNQIKSEAIPQDFIKHKGALFRRNDSGGYENSVFCRECKEPMISAQNRLSFVCLGCNTRVNFTGRELPQILSELPK
jgi:formylmethanofuran dehydrogenase subunit E